jgi:hypothetical protein
MKNCIYCKEEIKAHAKVCLKCTKHQNRFFNFFSVANVLSIGFLLISAFQFWETTQERKESHLALL